MSNKKKAPVPNNFLRSCIIGLFALGVLLYANTLSNGFVLDDTLAITLNKNVQRGIAGIPELVTKSFYYGASGENQNLYRPFTLIIYAIEAQFFGDRAFFWHLINVLLFGITCSVIFLFLYTHIFKKSWVVPLAAAILFAVHPIHTEVVANIKSIDELLALLGALLSLHFTLLYFSSNTYKHLLLAVLAFAVALFSKESAITYLGVLVISGLLLSQQPVRKIALTILPFLFVAGLYIVMRYSFVDKHFEHIPISQNSLMSSSNPFDRLATAIYIVGKYLLLLFVPEPLVCDYSFNQIPIVSFLNVWVVLSIAVHVSLLGLAVWLYKTNKVVTWAIGYYFITLSIVSNIFILIGTTMGERLLYMPSLGFCVLVPAAVFHFFKTDTHQHSIKHLPALWVRVFALVVLLFSFKTFVRNMDWKDNFQLFSKAVKDSPNSARVHYYMASEFFRLSEGATNTVDKTNYARQAIEDFKRAVDILPDYKLAWYSLGNVYYQSRDMANAEKVYEQTLKVDSGFTKAMNPLGVIKAMNGNYPLATNLFKRVIALDSTDSEAYANLGNVYLVQANYALAEPALLKAYEMNNTNENVLYNLIDLYKASGNAEKVAFYQDKVNQVKSSKRQRL